MPKTQPPIRIPVLFLIVGVALLVGLWLVRQALAPFFIAMVLAYLLSPLSNRLSRKLGRNGAALVVISGALILVALLSYFLIPMLMQEGDRLISAIPGWKTTLEERLTPFLQRHPQVQAHLKNALESIDPGAFLHGLKWAGSGVLSLFLHTMTLILVPVILYYLLLDGHKLTAALGNLLPERYHEKASAFLETIHHRLGGYIRGQLGVSLVMSLLHGLAFAIQGVPYAFLLGPVAGVSNVVPYSPYITALPPALLLCALQGFTLTKLLVLLVVFTVVQKVEALYLTPVWVGRASRLHPLEVLLAVLSFGLAFGLLGFIFAVPIMIVVKVSLEHITARYRLHPWFQEGAEGTCEPPPKEGPQQ